MKTQLLVLAFVAVLAMLAAIGINVATQSAIARLDAIELQIGR